MSYEASLKLDQTYDPALDDPDSTEYRNLKTDVESVVSYLCITWSSFHLKWSLFKEGKYAKTPEVTCALSRGSYQPAHLFSLIIAFAGRSCQIGLAEPFTAQKTCFPLKCTEVEF